MSESAVEDAAAMEARRLAAVERYDLLDTPPEEVFDRITALASKLFRTPIAVVTLIDGHRQWFKSRQGIDIEESPRDSAFCAVAIQLAEPLVVRDAAADPRFADAALTLGDARIRFYAGAALRSADGQPIGTLCVMDREPRDFSDEQVEILADLAQIVMDEIELRLAANIDVLTGAMSRRAFRKEAERAVHLAARHRHELSLVTFGLDHFKRINDFYGHPMGDIVLQRSAAACMAQLRKSDMMGRLGGEEFAVLLPLSGAKAACEVAERLRLAVAAELYEKDGRAFHVTASFGVVGCSAGAPDLEAMMHEADAALYEAKSSGRNRWVMAPPPEPPPSTEDGRRVLKSGQILLGKRRAALNCTVRTLSDTGARLDVLGAEALPERFQLSIEADRLVRSCRTVGLGDKHIEVEFG
jgi:diguanylate cyclase (GGDEF)-like protein